MLEHDGMGGTYDILVVLDQFRECADRHWEALGDIDKYIGRHLVAVEGYWDPLSDSAALLLQFSLQSALNLDVDEYIARTGLPMLVPSLMPDNERDALYLECLSRYCVYAKRHANDDAPRSVLVRTLMAMAAGERDGRARRLDMGLSDSRSSGADQARA